jgi:hypothetical protein
MSGAMVAAGIGAAGMIGGGLIGSHSAGKAADAQSSAANHAADLNYQASQNALAFQKDQYNQNQANFKPWLQAGQGGLSQLQYMLGLGSAPSQGGGFPGSASPVNTGMASYGGAQGGSGSASPINAGMGSVSGGMPVRAVGGAPGMGIGGARAMSVPGNGMAGSGGGMPVNAVGGQPGTGMGSAGGNPSALQGGGNVRPAGGPMMPSSPVGGQPSTGMGGAPSVNTSLGGFGSLMQPYGQQFQAPTGRHAEDARLSGADEPRHRCHSALCGGSGWSAYRRHGQGAGPIWAGLRLQRIRQRSNRAFNSTRRTTTNTTRTKPTSTTGLLLWRASVSRRRVNLGYLGQQSANGISNNLLETANAMGQNYQNAGAAQAQGAYNSGQAWNGAIGGGINGLSQLYQLQQLQKMGGGVGGSGSSDYFNQWA